MSESYLPSIERKNLARTVRLLADFYNTIGTEETINLTQRIVGSLGCS